MGVVHHRLQVSGPMAAGARAMARGLAMSLAMTLAVGLSPARAGQVFACRLSVDDGQRVSPPTEMIVSVAPDEYLRWADNGWTRNQCGPRGGAAPDVLCSIHDGHFQADFDWESNVGHLEHHVLINLSSGDLTVRDHNGLEQKGVCRPAPEPALKPAAPAKPDTPAKPAPKP